MRYENSFLHSIINIIKTVSPPISRPHSPDIPPAQEITSASQHLLHYGHTQSQFQIPAPSSPGPLGTTAYVRSPLYTYTSKSVRTSLRSTFPPQKLMQGHIENALLIFSLLSNPLSHMHNPSTAVAWTAANARPSPKRNSRRALRYIACFQPLHPSPVPFCPSFGNQKEDLIRCDPIERPSAG